MAPRWLNSDSLINPSCITVSQTAVTGHHHSSHLELFAFLLSGNLIEATWTIWAAEAQFTRRLFSHKSLSVKLCFYSILKSGFWRVALVLDLSGRHTHFSLLYDERKAFTWYHCLWLPDCRSDSTKPLLIGVCVCEWKRESVWGSRGINFARSLGLQILYKR